MLNKKLQLILTIVFLTISLLLIYHITETSRQVKDINNMTDAIDTELRNVWTEVISAHTPLPLSNLELQRTENALSKAIEIGELVTDIQNTVLQEDDMDTVERITEPLRYYFTGELLIEDWFYAPGGGAYWQFYAYADETAMIIPSVWVLWSDEGNLVVLVRSQYDVLLESFTNTSIHITGHAYDFWEDDAFYNESDFLPD